ncbi:MAG: hypothetical protein M3121_04500, partial [Chloroflexota bacterium]|nr:hypothetical protein [Chloroflexota bacterium]
LQYGGCFCKECVRGFRAWLQRLPADELPFALREEDLSAFHYGEWLLARGYDFKREREATPLYWHYIRFQREAITRYFGELTDYAREYAASKGRSILVSGNFFNLVDHYYALEPKVDLVITEMRSTRYRQPAWYRYVAGFAGAKPVVVVENPYGGVVPDLVARLNSGKGYDLFRMSLFEAAALGANMSVPYGAWLGSIEQDAFYPPHELCVEIQTFLAEHEHLLSRTTFNEVAVVYSVESEFQREAARAGVGEQARPFWDISEALCDARIPYDVLFFPDGELRADTLSLDDLRRYRSVVLPDCRFLTDMQADVLAAYLESGGWLVTLGEIGTNLPEPVRTTISTHPALIRLTESELFDPEQLPGGLQVRFDAAEKLNLAVNIQRVADGAAVHLIRYDFDEETDRVGTLESLTLELRLPSQFDTCRVFAPAGAPSGTLTVSGDVHRIELRDVPLYTVVHLT